MQRFRKSQVTYDASGPATSFHVFFYENGAGDLPGDLVASRFENTYTGSNNFVITLTSPVTLTEGHYWVSVQARQDITQAGFWLWMIALSNRTLAPPGKTPATVSALVA